MMPVFTQNLDFFYLFSGVSFFVLGTSAAILYLQERKKKTLSWRWLSVFGFLYGLNSCVNMFVYSASDPNFMPLVRASLLAASFLSLIEFSRRSLRSLRSVPLTFLSILPVYFFLGCLFFFSPGDFAFLATWIRYLLGGPAVLAAGSVLWMYCRQEVREGRPPIFCRRLSAAFFFYAIVLSLVVPEQSLALAPFLSEGSFLAFFGFPVQLLRGLLSLLIAFIFIERITTAQKSAPTVTGRLRRRADLLLTPFVVFYVVSALAGYRFVSAVESRERYHLNRLLVADARLVADALGPLDADFVALTRDQALYPKYLAMHKRLAELADVSAFIRSLYLVAVRDGKLLISVGSRLQVFPQDFSPSFGGRVPSKAIFDALNSREPTLYRPSAAQGETCCSGIFVPLFDAQDRVVALLGVDLDDLRIRAEMGRARLYALVVFLAFLLLLVTAHAFLLFFSLKNTELENQKADLDDALVSLREAESQLSKSEETFRGILDNSPNPIFGFDRDLRLIFWNEGAAALYGHSRQAIINDKDPTLNKKFTMLFGIDAFEPEIDRVFLGKTVRAEMVHRTREGLADVAMTLFPVKDAQNHILFGIGLIQDISGHRDYEKKLAQAHARLKSVLDAATQVIMISTDLQGNITLFNAGAQHLLGYKEADVVGRHSPEIFHVAEELRGYEEELSRRFGRPVRRLEAFALRPQLSVFEEREWTFVCKDGSRLPVLLTVTGLRNEKNEVSGYLWVAADLTAFKEAERSSLESQQRYSELVDNLDVGVFRSSPGPEGAFVDVNQAVVKLTDADSREELMKHKVSDIYRRPAQRAEFSRKMLSQGFIKGYILEAVTLKGRVFWASVTAQLKTGRDGQPYFEGILQDITEQKRMELKLLEERDRLGKIATSIGAGLSLVDRDFRIIWVNEVLEDWFGKLETIQGRRCYETYQFKKNVCEGCPTRRAFESGQMQSEEQRSVFSDGRMMDFLLICSPIKNEEGAVTQVLELTLDITQRKKMEEELRRYSESLESVVEERTKALQNSELMFRKLFETAQDGIMIIEADTGTIIDANPYLLNLLECTRDDLQGRDYRHLSFWATARVWERLEHDLKSRVWVFYEDVLIQSRSGKDRIAELGASLYYVENRKILQCSIRDVTEKKKVEKIKTEFVSMVSHELRTPLAAIKEGVEIVADGTQGTVNRSQRECLGIALSNIQRLNRLIGDILDISKIQSNLLTISAAPCEVAEVVEQVYNLMRLEIEKRGMIFVTDLHKHLPTIMADRDRLIQILTNLLKNAVKFTRERSRIALACRRIDSFVEFSVRDEGPGIPQEELSQLFGKFVQLDSSLVRRVGGTGLGLYISKNLVEAMGGRIWVESKLGEGSVFKFTVPVKAEGA